MKIRQYIGIMMTVGAMLLATTALGANREEHVARIDSLIRTVNQMPDNEQKVENLLQLCLELKNVDTVRFYAEEMCNLALKLQLHEQYADACGMLAWSSANKGNYEKALSYNYIALRIYDSLNDPKNMAFYYNASGGNLYELKDYDAADANYHKALNIYTELGLESQIATVYRNLGLLYKDYLLYETAKKYFDEAIKIDKQQNSAAGLMTDYNYLAITEYEEYLEMNDTVGIILAKKYNDMSYEKAKEMNDSTYILYAIQSSLPICLEYAGMLEPTKRQKMLDSCVYIYHVAMYYTKNFGHYSNFYVLENGRARHLLLNRRYQDCLDQLEMTRKKAENLEAKLKVDYKCYIDCYTAMGDYKKALEYKKLQGVSESQKYDLETTLNSAKSSAKEDFERIIIQREQDEQKREMLFEEHKKLWLIINISAAVFILIAIGFAALVVRDMRQKKNNNKLLLQQKEDFETQRKMLANINVQITDSICYAKEIQEAIIPSPQIMDSLFGSSLIIFKPLDIVSGNFYWAVQKEQLKMLAVGDCMKRGVPGAFTSMFCMTLFNDMVAADEPSEYYYDPAKIVENVRDIIEVSIPDEDAYAKENFMEMALCVIDTERNTMKIAGTHCPVIIFHEGQIQIVETDNTRIGDRSRSKLTNTEISVQKGDIVYMFTDGIVNQMNGNADRETSFESFKRLLSAISGKQFAEQASLFNRALTKSSGTTEVYNQLDDILLVGIRI